jgi:hypothetical protein
MLKVPNLIVVLMLFFSCASHYSKKEVAAIVPCYHDPENRDMTVYNAFATAEGSNQFIARKKALLAAKSTLASHMSTQISALTESYVTSREFNDKEAVRYQFKSIVTSSSDEVLQEISIRCQKEVFDTETKQYKSYVEVYISKKKVHHNLLSTMKQRDTTQLVSDFEKFKKTFDAEMGPNY